MTDAGPSTSFQLDGWAHSLEALRSGSEDSPVTARKNKKAAKRGAPKRKATVKELDAEISALVGEIEKIRGRRCFVLWKDITKGLVDSVYGALRSQYADCGGKLDVVVNSSGGDIDAAYNLACLFQSIGNVSLTFVIPRWAKSAATLIVCAGDEILLSPVAELGPLDPRITQVNPMEERFEEFSPLHIKTTMNMIREEYAGGNKDMAEGLLKRLQFPLTLGSFLKALEVGKQYCTRLLKERMAKKKLGAEPDKIAACLTEDYADHGFCINHDEAKRIGLNVDSFVKTPCISEPRVV